jgi:hypothetical protein
VTNVFARTLLGVAILEIDEKLIEDEKSIKDEKLIEDKKLIKDKKSRDTKGLYIIYPLSPLPRYLYTLLVSYNLPICNLLIS